MQGLSIESGDVLHEMNTLEKLHEDNKTMNNLSSGQADGGQLTDGNASFVSVKIDHSTINPIPMPGSITTISEDDPAVKHMFESNYISTTKYTIFSFLPLGLLY